MGGCFSKELVYKALYPYNGLDEGDLVFQKGDLLSILKKNNSNEWWRAKNLRTKEVGLVPTNYITVHQINKAIENEDWWFDCNRRDANKQLMIPGLDKGTFLIRKSQDDDKYALSIRDFKDIADNLSIKHYHILKNSSNEFYIKSSTTFNSLTELVNHHKKNTDGLCCKLNMPCPKELDTIPFKKLEIDPNALEFKEKLGKGNFGEVWKALYKGRLIVAIKKLKVDDEANTNGFLLEAQMMHKVRHKQLVQLIGVCTMQRPLLIAMEFMENGALNMYLKNDQGKHVRFMDLLDISTQIADGMTFIELKGHIHRDLRGANVLVGEANKVKIADFGLSKIESEYHAKPTSLFPIKWAAPEVIEFQLFTIKSDIWSFGILLYEIITYGETPYKDIELKNILFNIKNGNLPTNPERSLNRTYIKCPEKFYRKMHMCWTLEKRKKYRLRLCVDPTALRSWIVH